MFHGMPLQCISLDCSTLHHALYHLTCHYLQTYVHAYAYIYIHKYEEEYKHKWKTHANKRTNIHIHNIHKPTYCHVHVHRMTLRHISQHHSKSHCLHCIHTKHNIHHDTTKQNIQTHKHAYITYHTHRHIAYAFCPRFQDISTGRHTKLQCTVGYSPFSLSLSRALPFWQIADFAPFFACLSFSSFFSIFFFSLLPFLLFPLFLYLLFLLSILPAFVVFLPSLLGPIFSLLQTFSTNYGTVFLDTYARCLLRPQISGSQNWFRLRCHELKIPLQTEVIFG